MADEKFIYSVELDADGVAKGAKQADKAAQSLDGLGKSADKATKSNKGFADSLKDIAGIFAGGALLAGLKSFFGAALDESSKFEQAFLKLKATANQTGQSFDSLKGKALELSKDGVIGLDKVTEQMSILAKQGFSADKAFEFIGAAKRVSAFGNIVGDAGQGVSDFIKFLQTGSAELAENMDPSLQATIKQLGGYAKVSQDATAKQKLINEVIKQGAALQGDYASFLQSSQAQQAAFNNALSLGLKEVGDTIAPIVNDIKGGIAGIITGLTESFAGLSDTGRKAVVIIGGIGTAIVALIPIIASFGATMLAFFASPVGLVVAAVAALTVATVGLVAAFSDTKEAAQIKELDKLKETVASAKEGTEEYTKAVRDLQKAESKLPETYRAITKELDSLNISQAERIRLLKTAQALESGQISERDVIQDISDAQREYAEVTERLTKATKELGEQSARGQQIQGSSIEELVQRLAIRQTELRDFIQSQSTLINARAQQKQGQQGPTAIRGIGGEGLTDNDFLIGQLQKQARDLQSAFKEFKDFISEDADAIEKELLTITKRQDELLSKNARNAKQQKAIDDELQSLALRQLDLENKKSALLDKSIEAEEVRVQRLQDIVNQVENVQNIGTNELALELRKIEIETQDLTRALKEAKAGEDELAKAVENAERRKTKAILTAAEQQLEAISEVQDSLLGALKASGRGEGVQAAGGIAKAGGGLLGGASGQALGIAGVALGVIGGLFAFLDSEAEEQKEKEKRRQEELERKRLEGIEREKKALDLRLRLYRLELELTDKQLANEQKRRDIQNQLFALEAKRQADVLRRESQAARQTLNEQLRAAGLGEQAVDRKDQASVNLEFVKGLQEQQKLLEKENDERTRFLEFAEGASESSIIKELEKRGVLAGETGASSNPLGLPDEIINQQPKQTAALFASGVSQAQKDLIAQINAAQARRDALLPNQAEIFAAAATGSSPISKADREERKRLADLIDSLSRQLVTEIKEQNSTLSANLGRVGSAIDASVQLATQNAAIERQRFQDTLNFIETNQRAFEATGGEGQAAGTASGLNALAQRIGDSLGLADVFNIPKNFAQSLNLPQQETFNLLLSVLEKIQEGTDATAKNTASLNITTDRQKSFLDVFRGSAIQGNILADLGIGNQTIQAPKSVAQLANTLAATNKLGDNDALNRLVNLTEETNRILKLIETNTRGETNQSAALVSAFNDFARRSAR